MAHGFLHRQAVRSVLRLDEPDKVRCLRHVLHLASNVPNFANDLWPGIIRPYQVLQERPFEEDVVGELHGMSASDRSNDAVRLEFGERLSIDIG